MNIKTLRNILSEGEVVPFRPQKSKPKPLKALAPVYSMNGSEPNYVARIGQALHGMNKHELAVHDAMHKPGATKHDIEKAAIPLFNHLRDNYKVVVMRRDYNKGGPQATGQRLINLSQGLRKGWAESGKTSHNRFFVDSVFFDSDKKGGRRLNPQHDYGLGDENTVFMHHDITPDEVAHFIKHDKFFDR